MKGFKFMYNERIIYSKSNDFKINSLERIKKDEYFNILKNNINGMTFKLEKSNYDYLYANECKENDESSFTYKNSVKFESIIIDFENLEAYFEFTQDNWGKVNYLFKINNNDLLFTDKLCDYKKFKGKHISYFQYRMNITKLNTILYIFKNINYIYFNKENSKEYYSFNLLNNEYKYLFNHQNDEDNNKYLYSSYFHSYYIINLLMNKFNLKLYQNDRDDYLLIRDINNNKNDVNNLFLNEFSEYNPVDKLNLFYKECVLAYYIKENEFRIQNNINRIDKNQIILDRFSNINNFINDIAYKSKSFKEDIKHYLKNKISEFSDSEDLMLPKISNIDYYNIKNADDFLIKRMNEIIPYNEEKAKELNCSILILTNKNRINIDNYHWCNEYINKNFKNISLNGRCLFNILNYYIKLKIYDEFLYGKYNNFDNIDNFLYAIVDNYNYNNLNKTGENIM